MLLICNFANCFSLIPRMSFSSLATCRPNISSASMSSEGPLLDPLPAEFVVDLGMCFSRLAARFTCELLECFRGTNVDESVEDSDISAPDMPTSAFGPSCASEASVICRTTTKIQPSPLKEHKQETVSNICRSRLFKNFEHQISVKFPSASVTLNLDAKPLLVVHATVK